MVGAGSGAMRCCAVPARRVSGVSANDISPPFAPPAALPFLGDRIGERFGLDAQHSTTRQVHRLAVEQDGVAGSVGSMVAVSQKRFTRRRSQRNNCFSMPPTSGGFFCCCCGAGGAGWLTARARPTPPQFACRTTGPPASPPRAPSAPATMPSGVVVLSTAPATVPAFCGNGGGRIGRGRRATGMVR